MRHVKSYSPGVPGWPRQVAQSRTDCRNLRPVIFITCRPPEDTLPDYGKALRQTLGVFSILFGLLHYDCSPRSSRIINKEM
jgi:hypothetical protein